MITPPELDELERLRLEICETGQIEADQASQMFLALKKLLPAARRAIELEDAVQQERERCLDWIRCYGLHKSELIRQIEDGTIRKELRERLGIEGDPNV